MIFHLHWLLVTIQVVRVFAVILGAAMIGRTVAAMRRYGYATWTTVAKRRTKFLVALIGAVAISSFVAVSIAAPITIASIFQMAYCAIFIYGNRYLDTVIPERLHEDHT